MEEAWIKNLPISITICNADGKILYMNEKSCKTFESNGGSDLIGKNVLDCHPEPARSKLKNMLETQSKNCYTIEKRGVRKMIYQTPWYDEDKKYGGFIELSMEIPFEMPHYKRE